MARELVEGSEGLEALVTNVCMWLALFFALALLALGVGGIRAPYGRYSTDKVGGLSLPLVPGRVDWWLHSTSFFAVLLIYVYAADQRCALSAVNLWMAALYVLHYVNRGPVFSMLLNAPKPIPLPLFFMTTGFCMVNGWLQGASLLQLYHFDNETAFEPHFIIGNLVFAAGVYINITSDLALIRLRRDGPGYKIPRGGMFEFVSGANFFGECVEWLGFAILCNTPAAWTFAWCTWCNIGPRAFHHHQWYLSKFEDYPKNRRALVPFLF